MAGVTLLKPELQKLGAAVLVKRARLIVCANGGVWPRKLCIPPLPACQPAMWGIGLLVKVRDLFIFPGPSVLVLSVNSVCRSPWSSQGGWGRKAHPASSQGGHHKTSRRTSSSGGKPLLDSNQQATSKKLYSTWELTSVMHKKCLKREIYEYFLH